MKTFLRFYLAALVIVTGLSAISANGQTAPSAVGGIKIRNFGQMDTNYYRGAQPKKEDYQSLKDLGVTTIIDLQDEPTKYEKASAEALGIKYINIPMDDAVYPSETSIAAFMKEIGDPANGVMYVHCKGGRHRTGVTGAVYRFTKYGWDYNKTMTEMENYNFDTSYGRKAMKTFVEDYSAKMKHDVAATPVQAVTAGH